MPNIKPAISRGRTRELPNPVPLRFEDASAEGEEDLSPGDHSQAVTWATDWTTETLVQQLRRKTILLDPPFQRRDAWTIERKSRFIESLILGFPIPQIVLAERKDKGGTFIVLDGKQRLLSLLQFCAEQADGNNGFALAGLLPLKKLNGITFSELNNNPRLDETLFRFQNQSMRTVIIKSWPNEDYLYTVFLRLNSNSVPLSPQELRKALHPGAFVSFADERSSASGILQKTLGLKHPDFRMRDVEIVVRYYAFRNYIADYKGNLKKFLDDTCKNLNSKWKVAKSDIETQFDDFESAITLTRRVMGLNNAFRKFTQSGYEGRLNRAVFDVFLFYFCQERYRERAATIDGKKIRVAYEKLCINDVDFLRSIETTTKSFEVVKKRFNTWGKELSKLLSIPFTPPL